MTALPSTRPYLIRAIHEWCSDNGFTPYIAVAVDRSVRVPPQHVVKGEIVLNIATDATGGLLMGNECIEFKARFGGVPQEIVVPVGRVIAIYARENGQGMAFPLEPAAASLQSEGDEGSAGLTPLTASAKGFAVVDGGKSESDATDPDPEPPTPSGTPKGKTKGKTSLRLVK